MKEIEEKLREYYASQHLTDAKVDAIFDATETVVRPTIWQRPAVLMPIACGLCLLLAGAIVFFLLTPTLEEKVVAEVLKNHAKQYAPEVHTENFERIQAALTRLDFPITPTQPEMLASLSVQGGRYCSIHGELAAQIALVDGEGNRSTLYIAPLTETLEEIDPGMYETEVGSVQIWHDQQRIFALGTSSQIVH